MSKSIPFHHWLKQRRKGLSLTQKDLARLAGCAEITLRKIEAGNLQPSPQLAASLARAMGTSDADLPGMTGFAPPGTTAHTPVERWRMPRRPHNLPSQLTPLIGRTQDIASVRKRLLADDTRLLGTIRVGEDEIPHLFPIERDDYNRLADATRAHLGADRFDAAWARGRATPFETAVEAAVSALEDVLRVQDQVPPG